MSAPAITRAPMTPVAYRVARRHDETHDVVTLTLEPAATEIDEPRPGQFTMLYGFGTGEVAISVSGCPTEDGVLRHTVRAVGAVTRALCALRVGDAIGVRGPFGNGWPVEIADGLDLLAVGGGIGVAPLRPVIRQAIAERDRFGRVSLVAGFRTPDDLLYRSELAAWQERPDVDVALTVDAAPGGWPGDVGVVTAALPRLSLEPSRTVAMVCGPEVMMGAVADWLLDAGVDAERIYVSLERNMECGYGQCGHCQLGPLFVCRDGPVVTWATAAPLLEVRGL